MHETTFPLLNLILAVFLSPEFGFFGFVIPVFKQTPFICARPTSAGDRERRAACEVRQPLRTWLYVAWRKGDVVKCLMREEGLVSACAAAGVRKTGWNRVVGLAIVVGRVGRVRSVRRVRRASGENK
jgi:hypothetical protein